MHYSIILRRLRISGPYKVTAFPWSCYGSNSAPAHLSLVGDTVQNIHLPVLQRVNLKLYPVPYPKQLLCVRHTASLHTSTLLLKENEKEPRGGAWSNFLNNVRMFAGGVKMLYQDMKLIYEYQAKHGGLKIKTVAPSMSEDGKTDILYSREELQFVYKNRRDFVKLLPIVLLFFIPFVGYASPILGFMYPEKLLSQHFWTPTLRDQVRASVNNSKKSSFEVLLCKLEEGTGLTGLKDELAFIPGMIECFSSGNRSNSFLLNEHALCDIEHTPVEHLEHLCVGWEVGAFLSVRSQQQKLGKHLAYVFTSDWLIALEGGVKELSDEEILLACLERGLHSDPERGTEEKKMEMKNKLERWVYISTQYKKCPMLLLAYLPVAQYR